MTRAFSRAGALVWAAVLVAVPLCCAQCDLTTIPIVTFNRVGIVVSDDSSVTNTMGGGDTINDGDRTWLGGGGMGQLSATGLSTTGVPYQLHLVDGDPNVVYINNAGFLTYDMLFDNSAHQPYQVLYLFGASNPGLTTVQLSALYDDNSVGEQLSIQLGRWTTNTPQATNNVVAATMTEVWAMNSEGSGSSVGETLAILHQVEIDLAGLLPPTELGKTLVGVRFVTNEGGGWLHVLAATGLPASCDDCASLMRGCNVSEPVTGCASVADVTCTRCYPGYTLDALHGNCTASVCAEPADLFRFRKLSLGSCATVTTDETCALTCVAGYAVDPAQGALTAAQCEPRPTDADPSAVALRYTRFNCLDVNECSVVPPVCGDGWLCTNSEGSHTCTPLPPTVVWIKECPVRRGGSGSGSKHGYKHKKSHRRGGGEGEGESRAPSTSTGTTTGPVYKWDNAGGRYYEGEGEAEGSHDRIPKARYQWRDEDTDICVGLEWAALGAPSTTITRAFLHVASSFRSWELDDIANPDITTTVTVNGLKRGTTYAFSLVAETPAGVHRGLVFKLTTPTI